MTYPRARAFSIEKILPPSTRAHGACTLGHPTDDVLPLQPPSRVIRIFTVDDNLSPFLDKYSFNMRIALCLVAISSVAAFAPSAKNPRAIVSLDMARNDVEKGSKRKAALKVGEPDDLART